MQEQPTSPPYQLGRRIELGSDEATDFLREGFSFKEPWGRWTEGPRAVLAVRHGEQRGLLLVELWVARSHAPAGEACDVVLITGWGEPKLFSLGPDATRLAIVASSAETLEPGLLEIELLIARPKTVDEPPADARALGLGLEAFRVTRLLPRP